MPRGFKEPHRYPPVYEELIRLALTRGRVGGTMDSVFGLNRERTRIYGFIKAVKYYAPNSELAKLVDRIEVRTNQRTLVLELVDVTNPEASKGSQGSLERLAQRAREGYNSPAPDAKAEQIVSVDEWFAQSRKAEAEGRLDEFLDNGEQEHEQGKS